MPVCGFGGLVSSSSLLIRRQNHACRQAEIPLIALFKNPEPALSPVNRVLERTFTAVLLKREVQPELFGFYHNGITISAAKVEEKLGELTIYNPRLLNGA